MARGTGGTGGDARERRSEKEARGEGSPGRETTIEEEIKKRSGVTRRSDTGKYVVEMRVRGIKWHLGTYQTPHEVMVARDYGAYLRVCGRENNADAGGFRDGYKTYYYENSPEIFQIMYQKMDPRHMALGLLPQPPFQDGVAKFHEAAKNDIKVAIDMLRPHVPLPSPHGKEHVPMEVEPSGIQCTPSSSNAGAMAGPEPAEAATGSDSGGWCDARVQISVSLGGTPIQVQLDTVVLQYNIEIVFKNIQGWMAKLEEELREYSVDAMLERLPPCPVDPLSIVALEKVLDPKT